jgi:hypothetical protein
MFFRSISSSLFACTVLSMFTASPSAFAQEETQNIFEPQERTAPALPSTPVRPPDPYFPFGNPPGRSGDASDIKSAIRQAAEHLRDAETDEAKTKAEQQLRDLLTKFFNQDLQRRQSELKEMQARLSKLQEQLDRRQTKMDEIIDLQMKVLVNQADGLGFFSDSPSSDTSAWTNAYWYQPGQNSIRNTPALPTTKPYEAPTPAPAPVDPLFAPSAPPATNNRTPAAEAVR